MVPNKSKMTSMFDDSYDDNSDGVFSCIAIVINTAILALTIYFMFVGTKIEGGGDL